mmetsp:Transcript_26724/g.30590  ORF Transcript_26724/g.30590 Transcript_26724/m.30590 type:complete len:331 (-) Transcript_26724:119-1111(-)
MDDNQLATPIESLIENDELHPPSQSGLTLNSSDRITHATAVGTSNATTTGGVTTSNTLSTTTDTTTYMYPIVDVIAPAALSSGYTFDVEVNHEVLSVTVPWGGVMKGQKFRVQTQPKVEEATHLLRIPIGLWKDGLFEICKYGPLHPSFCVSWCFPLISLGHIFTRLGLNENVTAHNYPPGSNQAKNAFKVMVIYTFIYIVVKQFVVGVEASYHWIYLVNLVYFLFIAILAGRTRKYVRDRYDIPSTFTQLNESGNIFARCFSRTVGHVDEDDDNAILPTCCAEMEDYCLSCCCYPCVISQMHRHTAMYDTYEGSCFSSNGLPKHAPAMI